MDETLADIVESYIPERLNADPGQGGGSYVRRYTSYNSPGCTYELESCECDGYDAKLMSNPPQFVCYGNETCTAIDKFAPEGCDDN